MDLQEGLQRLGYQFVPFLLAVVGHEVGHGLVANWWGDRTAKMAGRLTLNPIPHLDLIGTVIFPMINMLSGINILFGWAKPVPIDPRGFRHYRRGLFTVALAGPFSNFIMAFFCAFLLGMMIKYTDPSFVFYKEFATMLQVGVYINYGLGFFNLIPLPPLDGSKMVESFLSYTSMQKYEQLGQYSFFILIALLLTGAISVLNGPILAMAGWTFSVVESLLSIAI